MSEDLPQSSYLSLHFPLREGHAIRTPEDVLNPELCDGVLSEKVLRLALLLEDVNVVHGLGTLSTEHTEADVRRLGEACQRAAARLTR